MVKALQILRQGDSGVYNFSQVRRMFFYYDRISVKEGIDLETYKHCDESTLAKAVFTTNF